VEDKVFTKASWFAKCGLQKVEAVNLSIYLSFNYKSYIYENIKKYRDGALTMQNSYFYIKCAKRVFFVHEKVFYAETKVEAV
jgi:hypothetical protein